MIITGVTQYSLGECFLAGCSVADGRPSTVAGGCACGSRLNKAVVAAQPLLAISTASASINLSVFIESTFMSNIIIRPYSRAVAVREKRPPSRRECKFAAAPRQSQSQHVTQPMRTPRKTWRHALGLQISLRQNPYSTLARRVHARDVERGAELVFQGGKGIPAGRDGWPSRPQHEN